MITLSDVSGSKAISGHRCELDMQGVSNMNIGGHPFQPLIAFNSTVTNYWTFFYI